MNKQDVNASAMCRGVRDTRPVFVCVDARARACVRVCVYVWVCDGVCLLCRDLHYPIRVAFQVVDPDLYCGKREKV